MKGKKYFKAQNEADIVSKMIADGVDRKTALTELWVALTDEEKEEWEQKAANAINVAQNQTELPGLLAGLLKSIAQSGRVGRVEFSLILAFRQPDGVLNT
ncbi:hypothetical protein BT96DRAFT_994718 [Gymnopus androsaceus JB14]|uniref:Uncharacterized protein n=1 Tax=Gymnopus androsaceus JB14 TaxID=1447944 RepID=A0A6A4HKX1_9AGAR|nr:hypothetical protein BT96DRAFT_994718 [Gymnopus androsaceus JB14]